VFPNNKAGDNDPLKTYVTKVTAEILLKFAPEEWKLCLKKIIELAYEKDSKLDKVLYDVDIPRVNFFIKFWEKITNKPDWLSNVCVQLEELIDYKNEPENVQHVMQKQELKTHKLKEQVHIAQKQELKTHKLKEQVHIAQKEQKQFKVQGLYTSKNVNNIDLLKKLLNNHFKKLNL
jgi:hypothetical protein